MAGDGLVADEDWAVVAALLPAGWREQAKATGALVRNRNFSGADALLRVLMILPKTAVEHDRRAAQTCAWLCGCAKTRRGDGRFSSARLAAALRLLETRQGRATVSLVKRFLGSRGHCF